MNRSTGTSAVFRSSIARTAIGAAAAIVVLSGCIQLLQPSKPLNFGSVVGMHPSDGAIIFSGSPTLRWSASDNSRGYRLQIAATRDKVASSGIISVSGTAYKPNGVFQSGDSFYWRIQHLAERGLGGAWSEIHHLERQGGTVLGMSPADAAATTDTTPELSWAAVTGAVRYKVRIAETEGGDTGATEVTVEGRTTYTTRRPLAEGRTYYWSVRAIDFEGSPADWSAAHSLRVNKFGFGGLSPADGAAVAETKPKLSWSGVAGATGYQVQMAESIDGLGDATEHDATGTEFTPGSALAYGKTYYWRVRAVNGEETLALSGARSLRVVRDAVAPSKPGNLAVGRTTVTDAGKVDVSLTWTAPGSTGSDGSGNASALRSYTVYYAKGDRVTRNAAGRSAGIAATSTTVRGLELSQEYAFIVTATNDAGLEGAESDPKILGRVESGATDPGAPSLNAVGKEHMTVTGSDGGARLILRLSWTEPTEKGKRANDRAAAITGYTVEWKEKTSTGTEKSLRVGAGTFQATVGGLDPTETYIVAVRATNDAGRVSLRSEQITPALRSDKAITGFTFEKSRNPGMVEDRIGTIATSGTSISVTVQVSASVSPSSLVPTIALSGGASVSPASGQAWDFSSTGGVTYTVRAEDGSTRGYTVTVSRDNAVTGLNPPDGTVTADTTPALSWTAVTGASRYEVQISASADFTNPTTAPAGGTTYTPTTTALANNTTHYWRVRAVIGTGTGTEGAWSLKTSLKTWGGISGMKPADGTTSFDTTPTLRWSALTGASRYEVQLSDTADFVLATTASVSGTSYTPSAPLPNDQTHHWRVRAVGANGLIGEWSTTFSLLLSSGTIGGMNPANGASTADTTPVLTWTGQPGATSYQIQIADTKRGVRYAAVVTSRTASYTPGTALSIGKTHFWRVRALGSDGGIGEWSAVFGLFVDSITGRKPVDGVHTTNPRPTLLWKAVPGATWYDVEVADTEEKLNGLSPSQVNANSFEPTRPLANNNTHYWRVRTAVPTVGAWSTAFSLHVSWAVIIQMKPDNGSTTADATPTFSWEETSGATTFEVQISDTEAGLENAARRTVTAKSYTPSEALRYFKTHYWRVRAVKNGEPAAVWSPIFSLKVDDGFVAVKGGTFRMGTPSGGDSDERPVHSVTLSDFWMSRYEVTQEEYKAVVGSNPSYYKTAANSGKRPVEQVSWNDAVKYCNALSRKRGLEEVYTIGSETPPAVTADWSKNGYRLPTEAEWEYAARGGSKSRGYTYSGSNTVAHVAWYKTNSGDTTHPVGGKTANELGLYDMSGNVWEWVWDYYARYGTTAQTNPKGPGSGQNRALRGGSWFGGASTVRSSVRSEYAASAQLGGLGFRISRTAD